MTPPIEPLANCGNDHDAVVALLGVFESLSAEQCRRLNNVYYDALTGAWDTAMGEIVTVHHTHPNKIAIDDAALSRAWTVSTVLQACYNQRWVNLSYLFRDAVMAVALRGDISRESYLVFTWALRMADIQAHPDDATTPGYHHTNP